MAELYTRKHYQEDYRIAKYVYDDHFSQRKNIKDDLIQSAVINLWKYREKYPSEKFKNLSRRIARNAMIDFLRKQKDDASIFDEISEGLRIIDLLESNQDQEIIDFFGKSDYEVLLRQIRYILAKYDKEARGIIAKYLSTQKIHDGNERRIVKKFRRSLARRLGLVK